MEHMCFLADVNQLYNEALGLYDLELTLQVAQQAQKVRIYPMIVRVIGSNSYKDPREYLPFLRKLQQLPELQRQFEIDNHLGRFTKALKHLHSLKAYDELRAYAIKHSLYKEALQLYRYQPEHLRDITNVYADYLYEQSQYKDAAIGKYYIHSVSFGIKNKTSNAE